VSQPPVTRLLARALSSTFLPPLFHAARQSLSWCTCPVIALGSLRARCRCSDPRDPHPRIAARDTWSRPWMWRDRDHHSQSASPLSSSFVVRPRADVHILRSAAAQTSSVCRDWSCISYLPPQHAKRNKSKKQSVPRPGKEREREDSKLRAPRHDRRVRRLQHVHPARRRP
jgi:hypothetical protein